MNILRMASLAAMAAALGMAATSAHAVPPSDRNANATARIVKPLTLNWVQDLDLGTIVDRGGCQCGACASVAHTGLSASGAPPTRWWGWP